MTSLLIIFAKKPAAGQVKTRLCPPLSLEAAAELYQAFLEDVLEAAGSLPGLALALAYSPEGAAPFFRVLAPPAARLFHQAGAGLGERMHRAFEWAFAAGFESVLLRGADTPDLPCEVILEGKAALETGRAQVVLGPSRDGGYYLVGLTCPQPKLFQGLAWSIPTVLEETLARARALGLAVHLLPAWGDIDTPADLEAFLARPHPPPLPGWRSHRLARDLFFPPAPN
jgi:hypothetical protein